MNTKLIFLFSIVSWAFNAQALKIQSMPSTHGSPIKILTFVENEKDNSIELSFKDKPKMKIGNITKYYRNLMKKTDCIKTHVRRNIDNVQQNIIFLKNNKEQLIIVHRLPVNSKILPYTRYLSSSTADAVINLEQQNKAISFNEGDIKKINYSNSVIQLTLNKVYRSKPNTNPDLAIEQTESYSDWIIEYNSP